MITRKKYLGILVMMSVLFIIFLFSVIVNEKGSFYEINEFVVEELPSGAGRWTASGEEEQILFIGGQNEELKNIVTQWCVYTKRELLTVEQPQDYTEDIQEERLAMILLDAERLDFGTGCRELLRLTELGVPVVFCNLPSATQISELPQLRDVLGIEEVVRKLTKVKGIRLFDGFFLGGSADYAAATKKEEKRQDMDLTVPWYVMQSGTKTYMVGLMEQEEVRNILHLPAETEGISGYFPSLIWRNSYKDIKVFAVCGDYMSTMAGLGILDSFCHETKEYTLYPVVNAQNVLVHNYPNLSDENAGKLMDVYSRSPQMYFQGIMWPSVSAMAKINDLKLTCLFNPQYDYADAKLPQTEEVSFYLQQLRELSSEAGMAFSYSPETTFATMLYEDNAFYEKLNSTYRFQVAFSEEKDLPELKEKLKENSLLQKLVTVSTGTNPTEELVSYLTDDVTLQRITGNAKQHSYMDDFVVRGIQTALVYSNVLVDFHDAVWPKDEDDEWQNLYDEMASKVRTYWADYRSYEQTTLSESDYRVRTMLNLDYSHERTADTVVLKVENTEGEACFLLRTHEEKIVGIRGGEFQKLETNAYLIKAQEAVVEIDLEKVTLKEQKKR